jgi:hypothetical protein
MEPKLFRLKRFALFFSYSRRYSKFSMNLCCQSKQELEMCEDSKNNVVIQQTGNQLSKAYIIFKILSLSPRQLAVSVIVLLFLCIFTKILNDK